MFFTRKQTTNFLLTLIFVFSTRIQSNPIEPCDKTRLNCSISIHFRIFSSTITTPLSTTTTTSQANSSDDIDAFSENLKRAAIILAAIAVGLGILRICLMFCKSERTISRRGTVSPFSGRTDSSVVKADLPPGYAEALAHPIVDGGKLPKYEELPSNYQSPPYTIERDYSTLSTST